MILTLKFSRVVCSLGRFRCEQAPVFALSSDAVIFCLLIVFSGADDLS
jgi:hypothetical protein